MIINWHGIYDLIGLYIGEFLGRRGIYYRSMQLRKHVYDDSFGVCVCVCVFSVFLFVSMSLSEFVPALALAYGTPLAFFLTQSQALCILFR